MGHLQPRQAEKQAEPDDIFKWRLEELLTLGLSPDEAMPLIEIPDIVNAARKLSERGCPPHLIASLLED